MSHLNDLRDAVAKAGLSLRIVKRPDGSLTVAGGKHLVHWWPDSRRQTAHVEGAPKGVRFCDADAVVRLAQGQQ